MHTVAHFKEIQFVLLKKISKNPKMKDTVAIVANELYTTRETIAENLKKHVLSLQTANEDIRILNTMYILELLEQKETDEIRKVLMSPDVLKVVYQNILEVKHTFTTEKSEKLAIICARCIAYIGLCHPFVNDPLILKATN